VYSEFAVAYPKQMSHSPTRLGIISLTLFRDFDVVSKVASLAVHLDFVVEELFECSTIKDTIVRRPRKVDDEFVLVRGLSGSSGGLGLRIQGSRC
jgi:hypothetical protein